MEKLFAWLDQIEALSHDVETVAIPLAAPTVDEVIASINAMPMELRHTLHGRMHQVHSRLTHDLIQFDMELDKLRNQLAGNRKRLRASLAYHQSIGRTSHDACR